MSLKGKFEPGVTDVISVFIEEQKIQRTLVNKRSHKDIRRTARRRLQFRQALPAGPMK